MKRADPELIRALRRRTDMPIIDCRDALLEADGDMSKALEALARRLLTPQEVNPGASPGFWEQFARPACDKPPQE